MPKPNKPLTPQSPLPPSSRRRGCSLPFEGSPIKLTLPPSLTSLLDSHLAARGITSRSTGVWAILLFILDPSAPLADPVAASIFQSIINPAGQPPEVTPPNTCTEADVYRFEGLPSDSGTPDVEDSP